MVALNRDSKNNNYCSSYSKWVLSAARVSVSCVEKYIEQNDNLAITHNIVSTDSVEYKRARV